MIDRRAAIALTAALVAVPGAPVLRADLLGDGDDKPYSISAPATAATESGAEFSVPPPDGWLVEQLPNRAVLHSGGATIVVEAHDRDGRDVAALAERLIRMDRVRGASAAYDGGTAATADGSLAGNTCVVTTTDTVGTCVVLADDDVVVYVQSRGTPEHPAIPLDAVLADLQRTSS